MSKVIIIGIDGFDPVLIRKWLKHLPNIKYIMNDNKNIEIESTIPPDSICAWTSIFTGENPAEHGLIESINYLSSKKVEAGIDRAAYFRGKTFWDKAVKEGKKVCIINPFLAYPAWEVDGVMISGPVFEGGKTSTYPVDILNRYDFPELGGIVDFPQKDELKEFIDKTTKNTRLLADVSLKLFKECAPDLFFVTFLTMDRMQHFLWRFTDEGDIYYPGENQYKNSIRTFYGEFDKIIGKFMEELEPDDTLLVISDHGHGRRCSKSLNLNELLRRKGYLSVSGHGASTVLKKIIERTKVFTLNTLTRYDLQDWIYKIARFIPNRKALKKSSYLFDKDSSPVTLSNLCGANPFGGIDIKADTNQKYEMLRDTIIKELQDINKSMGFEIVKWVRKREDIYRGNYECNLPDILFELDEDYGVGMDFFGDIISTVYTHKKVSGGHRSTGVLMNFGNKTKLKNIDRPLSVLELHEYILRLLD